MSGVYIPGMEMPTSCYDCRFHEVYSYKDGEERVCEMNWEVLFGDEWGKNFKHPDCPLIAADVQEHTESKKCFYCGTDLRWDGDYDYSDCGRDGSGTVSIYCCDKCGTTYEVDRPELEEEEE